MKKVYVIISNGMAGIQTYESNLVKLLNNKKKDVYIINNKKKNPNNWKNRKLLTHYYSKTIWHPFKIIEYLYIIKKKNSKANITFIISNPAILVMYFFFIKFFLKNKRIIMVMHSHITNSSILQIIVGFVSSIMCNFIDKVIFVSKFTLNWWCKYFYFFKYTKYIVVHNFVYCRKKKLVKLSQDNFKIGFVGRLDKEKGFYKFLEIAKFIKNIKFKFFVYGNRNFKTKGEKKIKFCGWKDSDAIYKNINLLVVTSPIENCPFNVLESKINGIPTLSLSDGGIKEIIKNNQDGILLKHNSSLNLIKSKIDYIKENYDYFSKNCHIGAKKFNILLLGKKYQSFFKFLI